MALQAIDLEQFSESCCPSQALRRLLDKVCERYEGFVFLEDDCIFSADALEWTHELLEKHISPYDHWFGSCESIFFDSKFAIPPVGDLDALRRFAESEAILDSYVLLDFLPSTCFITRKEIWSVCSEIRSFVEGPESLTAFLSSMNRKTIAPVVPRASDIGMLHQFGYSVSNLGLGQVKEIKNTYLMSSAENRSEALKLYAGNLDLLFSASVRLNQSAAEHLAGMHAENASPPEHA